MRIKINPNLRFVEKPLPEDDPQQRQPAIDLARQQLNWQPTVSLEHGLAPTIDSFRSLWDLPKAAERDYSSDLLHRCRLRRRPDHGGHR